MIHHDKFGDRMKEFEAAFDSRLPKRFPIIMRLDGNSFSKFTKVQKFEKPFDEIFTRAMWEATKAVLDYCSGSMVAYTQSDEITILLRNDQTHDTTPFLANRVQKICSLVASTASVAFVNYLNQILKPEKPIEAVFDCRVFIVPENEVVNAFLWRQQDAFKNCVSVVAHYGLKEKLGRRSSEKLLFGKNISQQQEIIFQELGININNYPVKYRRGVCIYKENYQARLGDVCEASIIEINSLDPESMVTRSRFAVDENIPIFSQDREYIGKYLKEAEEVV